MYTLPETNFYKLIEIKFDNHFKEFRLKISEDETRKQGGFMKEFFKSLMMNFIEWKWDLDELDLDIIHRTYKNLIG